jgi:quinol monooxygenase YgiN
MSQQPYTGPGASVHIKVTVAPESVPKFFSLIKPAYDAATAEPECIFFEIYQNPAIPGEIKYVENWNQSVEWLRNVRVARN